ncbi:MAG: hypothetical protein FWB78_11325 [Treponema sp.]|nr:hypothetical protein [Treponema sp.]
MKFKPSNFAWGMCLLLIAAFVLVNQFSGFTAIGIGSIIAIIVASIFIVQCMVRRHFAPLPIPLAVLYIVLQTPLGLPTIQIWPMIVAAVLAYIGLDMLLPGKRWRRKFRQSRVHMETKDGNNPSVSVNFGEVSRHLHADALETVQLNCSFGAMEVFLDRTELSPNGAEIVINCKFGAIELSVPGHWQIIDQLDCLAGGVEIKKGSASPTDNAPRLTLSGGVSFGGIEVRRI